MGFFSDYHFQYIIRILASGICGALIGFERTNRAKEAGIRTHAIVACASCIMMLISKYGFGDLIASSGFDVDPSRMAQGIVTGVGFLGSGMIYYRRGSTQGLTTAAGVWATSGIGMALGAGMYFLGFISTFLILLVQFTFHVKKLDQKHYKSKILTISGVTQSEFEKYVTGELTEMGIMLEDVSLDKNEDGKFDYKFYIEVPKGTNEELLLRRFENPCSLKFVK